MSWKKEDPNWKAQWKCIERGPGYSLHVAYNCKGDSRIELEQVRRNYWLCRLIEETAEGDKLLDQKEFNGTLRTLKKRCMVTLNPAIVLVPLCRAFSEWEKLKRESTPKHWRPGWLSD